MKFYVIFFVEGFFMTKTIKEITEKFDEVSKIWHDSNYWQYEELKGGIVSNFIGKKKMEKELEKILCNFSNDSDDFATAFAVFITFVIRYNLGDENKTYPQFLYETIDKFVFQNLEDEQRLKEFLKELSVAICENDYDNKMVRIYNNYDYSIVSLYTFCYLMYKYCYEKNNSNKQIIIEKLINLYSKMSIGATDMLDYALHLSDYNYYKYGAPLPYCDCIPIQPTNSVFLYSIPIYWSQVAKILHISPETPIDAICFADKVQRLIETKSLEKAKYLLEPFSIMTEKLGLSYTKSMTETISRIKNKVDASTYLNLRLSNSFIWLDDSIDREYLTFTNERLLHIPTYLPDMNVMKLILQNNVKLKKAQENRKKILNSFSHRYKNMKTSSLYNVAHALLKMDSKELKKYGRAVLLEYGIKENLKKEVDILQLQFEDNIDILKEKIQNSTQQQPSQDNFSILEIINNVIKKCIITLVHDGGDESKAIRKFCFKDYDLISIRNSFEENVLFEENMNPVTWFRENIATKFEVNISLFWKEIFFKKHDYADNVISDLLTDILMNCLKYADKTKDIQFDFYDEDNFMIIKSSNTTVKDKTNIPSSGIGLESQNDLLNVLNKAEKKLDNSIAFSETDSIFSIEVRISKNLVRRNENV